MIDKRQYPTGVNIHQQDSTMPGSMASSDRQDVEDRLAGLDRELKELETAIKNVQHQSSASTHRYVETNNQFWSEEAKELRGKTKQLRERKIQVRKEWNLLYEHRTLLIAKSIRKNCLLRNPSRTAIPEDVAHGRATKFLSSMMDDHEETLPGGGNMKVLRNVFDLEIGESHDVIIRECTIPFWQSCIDVLNRPRESNRVCAVGSSGIGKSKSIVILIRMLLKMKHRVVYLIRTTKKSSWYYEFTPDENGINIAVYPEWACVASLSDNDTFHIVDPGKTKDDCDVSTAIHPKVLIVASLDRRHWGGREFAKVRGSVKGYFRYYPIWTLSELLDARCVLGNQLSEEDIFERYRQVGGIPRHVFDVDGVSTTLEVQKQALFNLKENQARKIAFGDFNGVPIWNDALPKTVCEYPRNDMRMQLSEDEAFARFKRVSRFSPHIDESYGVWSTFLAHERVLSTLREEHARKLAFRDLEGVVIWDDRLMKSPLIGLVSHASDSFARNKMQIISSSVAEQTCKMFMGDLWKLMLGTDKHVASRVFEAYTRQLIARGGAFEARKCFEKDSNNSLQYCKLTFEGCVATRLGARLSAAVTGPKSHNILYHSVKRYGNLIDFMYRDGSNVHAFQATLCPIPIGDIQHFLEVEKNLGNSYKLQLYYLIPDRRYTEFEMPPVVSNSGAASRIYHVMIPNPK